MTKRKQVEPLSGAQQEIMEIVWDRGEVTVSDVWKELCRRREVARNTIQTIIVRMEEKGWLKHRVQGRTFIYAPCLPRRARLGQSVGQLLDTLFGGRPEELVTALLENRPLTKREADRIRALIDDAEQDSDSSRPSSR